MTEYCWSFGREQSSGNGAHDAPEDVSPIRGAVPGTKKLTMVKAQAYLKAGKTRKSEVLDDFCESTEYCRRHAPRVLQQAGQRYLLGECILVGGATKRLHRHRPPPYGPAVQQALMTIWNASTFLGPVRLARGMLLFVENQKGAWASPSG
jgi:hypothetical protein